MARTHLLLPALVALLLCAPALPAAAQDEVTPPPARAEEQNGEQNGELAALWRRADALYAARDQPGNLDRADQTLKQAEKLAPGRYETLWRMSRSLFWRGELAPDDEKARFAKRGWELAEQALQAKADGVEGHYYAAINAGTYGQAIGVLEALTQGVEKPFLTHLRIAMEKGPDLDDGGPAVAMGRYHYELPWPKYDGAESIRILREVVKKHPQNLRAKLYLAESLLKEDQPRESLSLLEAIAAAEKGSGDPAETRLVRNRAKRLLPQVKNELE